MTKGIIEDILKLLNLEMGEKFEIKGRDYTYKFIKDGLVYKIVQKEDGDWYYTLDTLEDLIYGNLEIIKLPWKPKMGEEYWYPSFMDGDYLQAGKDVWCDNCYDYLFFNSGTVYRTKKECEEHLKEDYKKITGTEWKE